MAEFVLKGPCTLSRSLSLRSHLLSNRLFREPLTEQLMVAGMCCTTRRDLPAIFQQPANITRHLPGKAALLFGSGQSAGEKQVVLRGGGRDAVATGSLQRNQPEPRLVADVQVVVIHKQPFMKSHRKYAALMNQCPKEHR